MSELLSISLALEWKILRKFFLRIIFFELIKLFSSFFNSSDLFCQWFSVNQFNCGSKIFKISTLLGCTQLSEEFDCTYFLADQVLLEKYRVI